MKFEKKLLIILPLCLVFIFGGFFTTVLFNGADQNSAQIEDKESYMIKKSYITNLCYGDYCYMYTEFGFGPGVTMHYEYDMEGTLIELSVYIMNQTDFDFIVAYGLDSNKEPYKYYSYHGDANSGTGTFHIPHYSSHWYIVFIHRDTLYNYLCGDCYYTGRVEELEIINPSNSASWEAGSTQSITWDYHYCIFNYVELHLWHSGSYYGLITASTPNDGAYSWTLSSSYTYYDDAYQVEIRNADDALTYDFSDAYFEITFDSITVTSPTASSSWQAGSTHTIQWTSTGSISNVEIYLYYLGSYHSTISSNTPNDGSYSWTLPSSFTNYGDSYQIRIEDYDNPSTYDYSPPYFEIIFGSITVTSPTASSSWQVSTTHTIQWTSTGSISNVKIYLYYLGSYHSAISSNTPNDGSYSWTLPSSFTNYGDSYQIRIEDYDNPSTYDYSPPYFEITFNSITVTSPTVSSSWQAGSTHTIQWTSTGSISNVKIYLYYLGSYHSAISSNTPNDGSYSWTLPSSFTNYGDSYHICIEDYNNPSTYDYSPSYFEITSDDTGDGEPGIPGYNLLLFIGVLFGFSIILIKKRIKKLARI